MTKNVRFASGNGRINTQRRKSPNWTGAPDTALKRVLRTNALIQKARSARHATGAIERRQDGEDQRGHRENQRAVARRDGSGQKGAEQESEPEAA